MKNLVILILFAVQVSAGLSQYSSDSPFAISVSYYGDLGIHPGVRFSGYYGFKSFEKSKNRVFKKAQNKKGNNIKNKTYFGLASAGVYSHANNHTGWNVNIGAGYERIRARNGNLFGYSLTVGYLFRDYKFDTYELVVGDIETIGVAGSGGIVFSLAPHFGRDLSVKTSIPLKIQLKPIIQLMKYNHSMAPNAALELEFVYNL
ncbi:MAG: hypothetical protein AB8B72_09360 [Crocinitomicaceae bacterium]